MLTGKFAVLVLTVAALWFAPAHAAGAAGAGEKRAAPVKTGEVAIDFTLTDQEGKSHTLSAERGKRPVVLIFYRGHW